MRFSLEQAVPVLRHTPMVLGAMLSGLGEEWTLQSEGPGAWTPYEVVGHLTSIEESGWIDRTRVILAQDPHRVFEPIDREAGFTRYEGVSLPDLLQRFAALRSSNLELLASLVQPADLGKRGVHPDFGEVQLEQLLATWVVHDLNHLDQIVKTMAKQYTEVIGPWRANLPVVDAP